MPLDRVTAQDILNELVGGNFPANNQIIVYSQERGWFFDDHPRPADWTTISTASPSGTPTFGIGSLWVKTA